MGLFRHPPVVALENIKGPKVTMHRLRHPTPTHPTTTSHTHTHRRNTPDATHTVCKNGKIRGMTANFPFFRTVYITSYHSISPICHIIWSHITSYLISYFIPYSMTYRIIISYHIISYHIISYWHILERVHVNISVFSCDQAALQMVFSVCPFVRLSVCPSVRPSHLFDYVPIIVSS